MRIRVQVEFTVDEDSTAMAEVEVEAQLSDMVNSSLGTTIQDFTITLAEEMEIETEEDY